MATMKGHLDDPRALRVRSDNMLGTHSLRLHKKRKIDAEVAGSSRHLGARQAGSMSSSSSTWSGSDVSTSLRRHPSSSPASPGNMASTPKDPGTTRTTTHRPHSTATPLTEIKTGTGLLNVTMPAGGFVQCQPAHLGIAVSPNAAVHILIADFHDFYQRLDVSLPAPILDGWQWPAVNFPARTLLRMQVTSSPDNLTSPDYAMYVRRDVVALGSNSTICLDADDRLGSDASPDGADPDSASAATGGGHQSKYSHNTIKGIAGVLGGVLALLLVLVICMSVRRRDEKRKWDEAAALHRISDAGSIARSFGRGHGGYDMGTGPGATVGPALPESAHGQGQGLGNLPSEGGGRLVATSGGRSCGRRRIAWPLSNMGRAILTTPSTAAPPAASASRMAGLRYMAYLVPGLEASRTVAEPGGLEGRPSHDHLRHDPDARGEARRAAADSFEMRNRRVQDGGDGPSLLEEGGKLRDLPSYRQSQWEAKQSRLPKYTLPIDTVSNQYGHPPEPLPSSTRVCPEMGAAAPRAPGAASPPSSRSFASALERPAGDVFAGLQMPLLLPPSAGAEADAQRAGHPVVR
ncbi:hypothetical protein K437DRAFT_188063 [Tilletiaria anomala UBC 951]|uniref:Uncharacterized protein n=1 Tax=Tilletiaria anomala (strain ATCC 24038 / CBS 436.72 / UBC 951) TaxID=1037660 RepID=A0A066VGA5_TILAU|nr:uncharacterized protein K437DRAFT_188063 [Tilletiaria anomala UBC 951]KDN40511.1 hypothetical protein K437DRAFT_188063 [Tilletiaria anomala UBC 951]